VVSDFVGSSEVGSQLVQFESCSDSQRRLETVNKEVERSAALEAVTRQRLAKTATEKS
jgi:hypothetical protein